MPIKPKKSSKTEKVTTDPQTGRKTYSVKGKIVGTSATSTYAKGTSSVDPKPKKKVAKTVTTTYKSPNLDRDNTIVTRKVKRK